MTQALVCWVDSPPLYAVLRNLTQLNHIPLGTAVADSYPDVLASDCCYMVNVNWSLDFVQHVDI